MFTRARSFMDIPGISSAWNEISHRPRQNACDCAEVRGLAAAIWSEGRTGLDVASILVSAGLLPVRAGRFSICNIPMLHGGIVHFAISVCMSSCCSRWQSGAGDHQGRGSKGITIYTYVAMEGMGGKVHS